MGSQSNTLPKLQAAFTRLRQCGAAVAAFDLLRVCNRRDAARSPLQQAAQAAEAGNGGLSASGNSWIAPTSARGGFVSLSYHLTSNHPPYFASEGRRASLLPTGGDTGRLTPAFSSREALPPPEPFQSRRRDYGAMGSTPHRGAAAETLSDSARANCLSPLACSSGRAPRFSAIL
jgi:hypothetical protein